MHSCNVKTQICVTRPQCVKKYLYKQISHLKEKGGEDSKYCQSLCNQKQKYNLASICANNNILPNIWSFVRSGIFTAMVLNYLLLGFKPWNLLTTVSIYILEVQYSTPRVGGRISYDTSADIYPNLWLLNLEDANIFLRVTILLRHTTVSERFTLIFIGVYYVCCRPSYE